jgi:glycosyltransferase involved in cell wall biosynthesis
MNIAFDARYLSMVISHRENPEMLMGIGSYSYNLIKQLICDFADNKYYLLCDQASDKIANILPGAKLIKLPRAPQFRTANATLGRLYRGAVFDRAVLRPLIKKYSLDVLHYLSQDSYIQLGTTAAIVVTVHDLANSRFPEQVFRAPSAAWVWQHQTRRLGRADYIITDSEASRADVLKYCGARPEKASTVYCGKDEKLSPIALASDEGILTGYGVKKPYFLHVGGIQASKNMDNLVKGFAFFLKHHPGYSLVIAGELGFDGAEKRHLMESLIAAGLVNNTVMPGFIPQNQLPAFYRGAQALLHPSWYEGFGLTPLEAAACGCPSVISDRGSLPEVMERASVYVDPADPESIAGGMEMVLDPVRLRKLKNAGLSRAAKYSWARAAREVNNIYYKLGQ